MTPEQLATLQFLADYLHDEETDRAEGTPSDIFPHLLVLDSIISDEINRDLQQDDPNWQDS